MNDALGREAWDKGCTDIMYMTQSYGNSWKICKTNGNIPVRYEGIWDFVTRKTWPEDLW